MDTTRRTFLKGVGLATVGGAGADLTRSLLSDDHYDVAVFVTESTAEWGAQYGDHLLAAKRAQTWIEGAFDHPSNPYTVSVTVGETVVDAPTQEPLESDLLGWWADHHDDVTDVTAADSNLLLTTGGGGKAYPGGKYGVVGGGHSLPRLDADYQPFGDDRKHGAMSTVLHELGHTILPVNTYYLLRAAVNQDDPHVTHHDLGTAVEHPSRSDWYGITPMLYENEQNNCRCNEHHGESVDGYALLYADCMLRHLP